MLWEEVKKNYPNQWVIIEAIEAQTKENKRIIGQMTVVNTFHNDNNQALLQYLQLHRKHRERELYVVHTSRPELNIIQQNWSGLGYHSITNKAYKLKVVFDGFWCCKYLV